MRNVTLLLMLALFCSLATPLHAFVAAPPPAATNSASTTEAAKASVAEYKASLKAMTAKERRAFKKQKRQEMKSAIAEWKSGAADDNQVLAIIFAILIPPLGVFIHQGEINNKFWISLLLTLLFFLPGMIYALLVVTGNAK